MKRKELNEKVQLLKAGQIVEIEGDYFRACRIAEGWGGRTCDACELDSICKGDVYQVCCEMETTPTFQWILKLAHP